MIGSFSVRTTAICRSTTFRLHKLKRWLRIVTDAPDNERTHVSF